MNNINTFLFSQLIFLFINLQITQAQPFVYLGANQSVILGSSTDIEIIFLSNDIEKINWTTIPEIDLPCNDCHSFEITPSETTILAVQVTDYQGNIATDSITIIVTKPDDIYIPNVFSPNGDGLNDYFMVYSGTSVKCIKQMALKDRNMMTVFYKKDLILNLEEDGWDGKIKGKRTDHGIFIYSIEIEYIDGRTKIFHGDVLIFF